MATTVLVQALEELMSRGIWATKDDLMKEVLKIRPSKFGQLTDEDAFRMLSRGNDIAMSHGKPPVYLEPYLGNSPYLDNSDDEESNKKETVGRCVDLWKNDDILSNAPKKQLRRFGDSRFNNTVTSIIESNLQLPKGVKREQYFTMDFGVEANMEGVMVNNCPNYATSFSFPISGYPGDIVGPAISETRIEVVGSAETEKVES